MKRCLVVLLLVGSASACDSASRAAAPSEETARGTPTTTPAGPAEVSSSQSSQVHRATLTIDGMVCQGCAELRRDSVGEHQSLRELVRIIGDLEHEKQAAVSRARMMPWRMP